MLRGSCKGVGMMNAVGRLREDRKAVCETGTGAVQVIAGNGGITRSSLSKRLPRARPGKTSETLITIGDFYLRIPDERIR